MATHYVYDDPDKTQLAQGDVLERTPALVALLNQYHPHYANHPDYRFFAVLTQSCDLVRREDKPPKTPYIAIAAARTLEETLIREAARFQEDWQRETKVIGTKARSTLLTFLQRVFDNNEPGYFYLHVDQELGIHRACCVVLALAVTLRAQHYDTLLEAKRAQLKDTFQAKLGWLIGNMYSRVGTTEWDNEYPDNLLKDATKAVLDGTLHSVKDEQIKEGLAELRQTRELAAKSPQEIFEHIRQKNILPRSKKFEQRAAEVGKAVRLVSLIQSRATEAMHQGGALKESVADILAAANVGKDAIDGLAEDVIAAVNERVAAVMTDDRLPDRDEIVQKFIRGVLQDPQIAGILQ
jgi:hypothetical protein